MEKEEKDKEYFIRICSDCCKIRSKVGEWILIPGIDLTRERDLVTLTHGLCPECAKEAMLELEKLKLEHSRK